MKSTIIKLDYYQLKLLLLCCDLAKNKTNAETEIEELKKILQDAKEKTTYY